jgi:predicted DNA-binding protein (UPF0251 family)
MPRPRKCRRIAARPAVTLFKPQGVPLGLLTGVSLPLEGLEAMRLVDAEDLSQEEAAARMGVSRPTLCRILGEARAVVARALSSGWAIRLEGGDYELARDEPGPRGGRCCPGPGAGRGRCGRNLPREEES